MPNSHTKLTQNWVVFGVLISVLYLKMNQIWGMVVLIMSSLWCFCKAQQQQQQQQQQGGGQVPCYFIFGDSLVDNGNNNQLTSLARANYLPYGIDFPRGPTGRFSNGKTTVDVIGMSF